jgi:hypothetical protein
LNGLNSKAEKTQRQKCSLQTLYDDYALYFMEGQYFIQLWTAHLFLKYGQHNEELKRRSLDEIEKYADRSFT